MIFQEPMTALDPIMRIGVQVAEAIRVHDTRAPAGEIARRAIDALKRAAVPEPERRARQYPHQLSGGLRQRVMIAMALACNPKLLIADEPTTALDVTIQAQVLDLLRRLQQELGMAVLFVTHDLAAARIVADRIAVMYLGRIVEVGSAEDICEHPVHPYTVALLTAVPGTGAERVRLKGEPASPMDPPPGCEFHPRCPEAEPACSESVPALAEFAPGRMAACPVVIGRRS
jgi:oligopeptide/dipeptide ABC transporter ATP-binding protein